MSKFLKPLFLIFGLALFAWAVHKVDISRVGQLILRMGPGLLAVILSYGLVTVMDSLSWKFSFKAEETASIPFKSIWKIRTIGEAFNAITPFGTLGGEPVKAHLLKDQYGLTYKQGVASQVVARTTILIALILFFIPGIILLTRSETIADNLKQISLAGLVTFTILILLFLLFQISGSLARLTSWYHRVLPHMADDTVAHVELLDQMMSGYYKNHKGQFIKSVGFGGLGWLAGLLELFISMHFLGQTMSLPDLWVIETLSQLIRVGSFFIPLNLGTLESGVVIIFAAMGLDADLALAVVFVRRIRELCWIGTGLLLGGGAAFRSSKEPLESEEAG
ncbi:MAG: flippase-like domain-containing protein [Nitrospinaceae bacterium]|nr:flippase-like domain-containing protein [Nitrospinaceae bacterium]NIR54818.1 flippase-like domain-containing protein [Nitrospinaceae bacterium]NIS85243.1 flippase-like domain-containing protein [Nitrospinaceae bacterium]NIT82056.1 flippase-like domain-containing protein [Nitrospinaceae bacterium]NIU44317.1 flippase-like domain-containing protein [Nitrospinaceae bacterium]